MPSQKSLVATPPSGVLRLLLRLPIALYRLRLGKARELSQMLTGANLAQASSEELERIVQEALPIGALRPQAGDATP